MATHDNIITNKYSDSCYLFNIGNRIPQMVGNDVCVSPKLTS